ncbi:MAG: TPM domain-containing protein [Flavobacteriales bacterium]|nr:TPM domain-containing protein [Flavobacteriales bacterium]
MTTTTAAEFLTDTEREQVKLAVREAEHATSGEIRVHLDDRIVEDTLDHAAFVFEELGMHRTEQRNGVLIYVSVADHRLAVLGDKGINAIVPKDFWKDVIAVLRLHFAADERAQGLSEAVRLVGEKLKTHFPYRKDDRNELPDDISIGQ